MTKDEALKLALEALQWKWGEEFSPTYELQVINAIKEALEQPEQEPLGWCDSKTGWIDFHRFKPLRKPSAPDAEWLPLYTSPPQRKPLTDEQIEKIIVANLETWNSKSAMASFVRAIEAAHGIKSAVK